MEEEKETIKTREKTNLDFLVEECNIKITAVDAKVALIQR